MEAVASSPFHRNGSPTTELADLTGVLQRRKDRQVLLSTRSQRVLKKLHIARSWSRQTQSYASANTDRIRNHNAVGVQAFLNAESNNHEAAAVAATADWRPVNSVFCLKCNGSSSKQSGLLVTVLAWSESLGLVRWCSMQDSVNHENFQEQYFSLSNAKHNGIYGELVSCGEAKSSAAILQALESTSKLQTMVDEGVPSDLLSSRASQELPSIPAFL